MNTDNIIYFNTQADARKERRITRYYWNEITRYCSYFAHEDASVLEIGCGSGSLLAGIPGKRKLGIDVSASYIAWAREKQAGKGIEFLEMDANGLQLDEQFDLILLSNLVGYVDNIQNVFEQLRKVCHPGTRIIVQYYNSLWEPVLKFLEFTGLKAKTPVQNWLTSGDIDNLLYLAGFDVYRHSKRMLCPVYLPLLSEVCNRYLCKFPFFRFFTLNMYSFARPIARLKEEEYAREYSVSVIIPARNESGNIEQAIRRMPVFGKALELIFVEGHSHDATWSTIQSVKEKYAGTHTILSTQQKGKGKADAVREGFAMASGDILMILDADLTVAPEELPKFYNAIAGGLGEFINGSRLVYPMEKQAMRFLNYLGNHFFSWTFTWLLEQRFKDTLCGTKVMFRKDYLKLIKNRAYFGEFDPFGDFDLLFGAYKLNLKMVEVPIRYRERTYGNTNISRFRHGLILLRMCFFASRKCKFI